MAIEPEEVTKPKPIPTPIDKEQDKADPVLEPHTTLIDKKQKAQSCVVDFDGGLATLNVEEGEHPIGGDFMRVRGVQVVVDLATLAKAIANKSEATIMDVFAQYVLDEATKDE